MRYKSVTAIFSTCFGVLNNNSYIMANVIKTTYPVRCVLKLDISSVLWLGDPTYILIVAIRYNNLFA